MKNIIIFVVVVAGAFLAWNNLPGLRDKVTKTANEYGGWTEEARKGDPVGFIEHAISELEGDITEFKETQTALVATKKENEDKLEEYRDEQADAKTFASAIKEQFKTAEETQGWPITLAGKKYQRTDAITLVNSLLATDRDAGALMAKYEQVITMIDAKSIELRSRIDQSEFNVKELAAQKQLVKADSLSAEADSLLAKVNDLVEGNSKVVDGPAVNYDDFLKDVTKQAKVEEKAAETDAATAAALEFLNS
ncbi:MAG: phage shock protein A [Planctomycetota bacterium]|jgi:phage shock protein A